MDRPDRESNQVKISLPSEASLTYAISETVKTKIRATQGRPFLSISAPHRGPIPLAHSAWMVRVDANVDELATEKTARVTTALNIEGRILIPARRIASTNGEYRVSDPEALERSGELDGTMSPRINNEMT